MFPGNVDDLFTWFMQHIWVMIPHLECMEDLKKISDLTLPANWYVDFIWKPGYDLYIYFLYIYFSTLCSDMKMDTWTLEGGSESSNIVIFIHCYNFIL